MRRILFAFFLLIFCSSISYTQSGKPTKILKTTGSDRSIEFRNMKIVVAGESAMQNLREVPNNSNPSKPRLKFGSTTGPASIVQKTSGPTESGSPIICIEGIDDVLGAAPSDANGDVGLNHYVQSVNSALAIWDKSGNLLYGPVSLSTLWDGFEGEWEGSNDGDPVVVYDELADRWLVSQFYIPEDRANGTYYQLTAISATEDPLGMWYRYAFPFENLNDYPKFGVWPDGYYSTYHMYDTTQDTMAYQGPSFVVFDREAMLSGKEEAAAVVFDPSSLSAQLPESFGGLFSTLPADFDGPPPADNTPFPVVGLSLAGVPVLYEITMNWEDPQASVASFKNFFNPGNFTGRRESEGVPQPGHDFLLDPMGDRFMHRLQYRNFGSHEVLLTNISEDVDGIIGIRWIELRRQNAEWSIYQQGTYSPDSLHRWMGSIAMNGKGDIALGYSVGAKNKWASVRYTGRSSDSDQGLMNFQEVESKSGTKNEPFSARWGDYSSMSVDPADDETFWYTSQYSGGRLWKTNIVSFKLGQATHPIVHAGEDASICSTDRYNMSPTISNQKSLLWTTSGDGNILWADEAQAQYKPGTHDIENGQVYLILNAYGWAVGSLTRDSVLITIENCTGIVQFKLEDQISVVPNPSSGVFSFEMNNLKGQNIRIELMDIQSRVIFTQKLENIHGSYSNQLDLQNYPKGTYYMRFIEDKSIVVRKLIKL